MLEQSWHFWLVQNSLRPTAARDSGRIAVRCPKGPESPRNPWRYPRKISKACSSPFGSRRDKPERHLLYAQNRMRTSQCDRAGLLFGSYPDGTRPPNQCERVVAD